MVLGLTDTVVNKFLYVINSINIKLLILLYFDLLDKDIKMFVSLLKVLLL